MHDDYPIDLVLNETHQLIEELKTQLAADSNRLAQLEAMIPTSTVHINNNDYSAPAWFGE